MDGGDSPMSPGERLFREHLAGGRFQTGSDRKLWRVVGELLWPHVVIAVASAPRDSGPSEFALRFDLDGYPNAAPTATPWNTESHSKLHLARWPKGHRVGMVFRPDWNEGQALYAPYDRAALFNHDAWRTLHPRYLWDPTKDITFYLRNVHELLNDDDYQGI